MSNRTLARRLTHLERRFGSLVEPTFIRVVFVGPDGEREEGSTIQVGGRAFVDAKTARNQRTPRVETSRAQVNT
jgi:hypothetical protein